MKGKGYLLLFMFFAIACSKKEKKAVLHASAPKSGVSLYILGTAQDGGSPHIGCKKECCSILFENPDHERKVVSLGIVDHENSKSFLFEATPDMPSQLRLLKEHSQKDEEAPDGIFLTHAHIGHYTGLMYLGREAMGAKAVALYSMPKMKSFLENNDPWNQLVDLKNILITEIENEKRVQLTSNLSVIPFTVPHRDEYSETVGYKIIGNHKSALFIPDIDKWSKWEKSIVEEISKVDFAFLDATFHDGKEINNRDISEIPHPFVIESTKLFERLPDKEKAKIHFIHFNHTNPLLNDNSDEFNNLINQGFNVAQFNKKIDL